MIRIDLREEVNKALAMEWDAFAARHPRLAKVIDRTLLLEEAVQRIDESPEYRLAMERAAMVGQAAESIGPIIRQVLRKVLSTLL